MIQAQIMALEVQLWVIGTYLSPDNPELSGVQSSLAIKHFEKADADDSVVSIVLSLCRTKGDTDP